MDWRSSAIDNLAITRLQAIPNVILLEFLLTQTLEWNSFASCKYPQLSLHRYEVVAQSSKEETGLNNINSMETPNEACLNVA